MTFYAKRRKFDKVSERIGRSFARLGVKPDHWTILTLIPTVIALYFLIDRNFLLAGLLFITAAFIDTIDGAVARFTGKVTRIGAYLDTIMDRYVEWIVAFGLLFAGLPGFYVPASYWIFLYLLGSFMTSYSKPAAMEKDLVNEELKGGLLERAERLIILFIGILLAALSRTYLTYIIVILAILTNFTALQRIKIALDSGKGKSRQS